MSEHTLEKKRSDSGAGDDGHGLMFTVAAAPIKLSFSVLSRLLVTLRPYAPRLIPLLVCSLFIPLVILLSASAGWVVWSSLSISWQVPLYLQYGDGVPPYAYVQLPRLMTEQRYLISADLVLPATDSNLELGNFMTSLTLSTSTNRTLAHIRRPTIVVPPQSRLFFGTPASVHVKIPLIEAFVSSSSNVAASVEIGRRDGWTTLGVGHGREVSIASASLRGLAVPHGIRGVAIRFPLLASFASGFIFFVVLSLTLGFCILPLVLPSMQEDDAVEVKTETQVEGKRRDTSSSSQRLLDVREGRRRRRSRSGKSEDERQIKTEAQVHTIPPPAESPSAMGLRRRSSKAAMESET